MFIVLGLFFALFAQNYDFGTAQRMGPAFFPTLLGGLLAFIGVLVLLKGLAPRGEDAHQGEKFHLGPRAGVHGAVIGVGATLRWLGFVVSMAILVIISSMASHEMKWKEVIALSIGMAIFTYLVFIVGLKMTIPVLPAFMSN